MFRGVDSKPLICGAWEHCKKSDFLKCLCSKWAAPQNPSLNISNYAAFLSPVTFDYAFPVSTQRYDIESASL